MRNPTDFALSGSVSHEGRIDYVETQDRSQPDNKKSQRPFDGLTHYHL
jgi:hypothetical protein